MDDTVNNRGQNEIDPELLFVYSCMQGKYTSPSLTLLHYTLSSW